MADNNLSKNIKIGIDVELNKRSLDEVTRRIEELSKNAITLKTDLRAAGPTGPSGQFNPGSMRFPGQTINSQAFVRKLFESFFDSNSKISTKKLIEELPTKELKKAAGEMVDIFKDVKEQLREVGQQLKFDQNAKGTGSARFITAPLGQGRPTRTDVYSGRNVVSADFDKLVNEVKNLRGKDSYTRLGASARGNMEIEGLRQLVLKEIERLVGGSVGSGVKVAGLAQYMKPRQPGLSAVEETEFGVKAVSQASANLQDDYKTLEDIWKDTGRDVNSLGEQSKDFADALEGLDDATAAAIVELNKNAKNIAKLIGLKDLPTKIDPREAADPEIFNDFSMRMRRGDKAGIKSNIRDFADFAPAKGGAIAVSPALLEMAFENVIKQIAPGTRVPGGDIVEAKATEALAKIAPLLDKINSQLFDENINNPNSGKIWGTPLTNTQPKELGYNVPPYGTDSMRKLSKFIGENPEAYGKFQEKIFNDIMQGALDAAMEAEQKQVDQLTGGDFTGGEEIQHGVNYIVDGINNAVLQYEQQMGLELGTIFHSIGSTPNAELKDKLETYFLKNIQTNIVGNLGSVLGQPFRESVTDTMMTFDTYKSEGSANYRASRAPYSEKEIESINRQIADMQKGIQSYKEKIKETEAELKGAKSEDVMLQLSAIIENYSKAISDFEGKITNLQLKGLSGKFIPAAGVDLERVDPTKLISTQMLFRPEFLKQAKITTGIQDMMMQIMAGVPKQVEEVVAEGPFDAIFKKYEGLGLGGIIEKLKEALKNAGGDASKLVAGFDTEFNSALATPINELSIVMRDAFGKSEELLGFFHRPAPLGRNKDKTFSELSAAQLDKTFNRGLTGDALEKIAGPKSVKNILENAQKAQFDMSKIGGETLEENLPLYKKKIEAANNLLSLLEELGIAVAGNNLASAEFSSLVKSAEALNLLATQYKLEPTAIKNSLNNLVDVYAIASKLQKAGVSSPEFQSILAKVPNPDKDKADSGLKLGELVAKVMQTMPGALPEANVADGQLTGINGQSFHVAKADATASAALHDLFKKAFADYAAMASMTQAWASHQSYGPGAMLYPYSKEVRQSNPAAFQQQPQLDIPQVAEAPVEAPAAFNAEARQEMAKTAQAAEKVADAQEKQAVATETSAKSLREQTMEALAGTEEWRKYQVKVDAAQAAIAEINQALFTNVELTKQQKHELIRERARLADDIGAAELEQNKLKRKALEDIVDEKYLKELRRGPYDTLATQQLTGGGSVVRNIDRGRVGAGFGGAGRPPGGDGYITERGGEFLGPDPKKTRDASEAIKRQLKDQVQAEKEAEQATKSLVNTWVTGRYALYDVGNAFQNVSQKMFAFTKTIFQFTNAYKDYESAFTSVDRAMQLLGDETQGMADMFIMLSETMPISFEQLTAIGTLGAQMGVTADGIKNFTEVVAKFSSVTGISAETTAQKFGRIAELADVDYAQFENLGSAIAYAGVNAVATEAEILSLTESIAAISEQAGFAPEEIVGLSTAIASLGIAPEQARGVFTRVFADINRAVSKGGSELENFAKVSGMSSSEFASTWADSDGGAARAFRAMLAGLKTTGNMTQAFDDLNITETREVNTLTRLAENLNVVDASMQDANTAFEEGTFLGDSFEKTVDNLDSKIILFQNNFKSAMQSISQSAAVGLGTVLDIGSGLLKMFKDIAEDSVLGPIMNMIYTVAGIATVATGAVAAISKIMAQVYAFRTAMINTANDPNIVSGIVGQFKAFSGLGSVLVEDHSKLTAVTGKMGELKTLTYGVSDAFAMMAGNSSKAFSSILQKDDIYLSTGEGLAAAQGVDFKKQPEKERTKLARTEAQQVSQVVEARRQLLKTLGDEVDWSDAAAVSKYQQMSAEQIYIYTTKDGIKAVDLETQMKLKNATASQIEASGELKAAQANIANANANRAGAAALTAQTRAQSVASKGALGFGAALNAALGPIGIALTVISLLVMAYEAIATSIEEANSVELFKDQGGTAALREAIYKDTQAWMENGEAITTVTSAVVNTRKEVPGYKTALQAAAKGQEALKTSTEDATDKINEQTLAIGQNTKELLAKALYENEELQDAFSKYPDIFGVIQEAGVDVSTLLEDMLNPEVSEEELLARLDNISNYAASDIDAYKNALNVLKQAIKDAKASVDDAISQGKLVKALETILDIGDGTNDFTDGIAADVRTVLDYANDLAGVFDRIQQISVERLTARDGIVAGWRNIREAANSAKDAVKAANQEIADLTSDQAMLQYQYDVAKRYGDERRMAILQAKMTANQTKLTDATKKRNDAEDQASMTLVGSSKAAIANRSTVNGMVDTYQNYVLALVRAGVKGKELQDAVNTAKESFIRNGESVGFSKDQLGKYVDMFDDFLTAVKKTPRNVTIEFIADMSAAENALNEFLAKANASKAKIKLEGDDGTGDGLDKLPGVTPGLVDPSSVPTKADKVDVSGVSQKSIDKKAETAFNSFKSSFSTLMNDFGGITSEAQANKKFGTDKKKFAAWEAASNKFKAAQTAVTGYGLDANLIETSLRNDPAWKFGSNFYQEGMTPTYSESGQKIIQGGLAKLPKSIQEAVNFLANAKDLYASDKKVWESTKDPYADAKELMGIDREESWEWIVKNKTGKKKTVNGKQYDIVSYIKKNGRDQFAEKWNIIKNNAQLGAAYRQLLIRSGYTEKELQPFFGNNTDWWDQRGNDFGKGFHPDKVSYATGGYVSGAGTGTSDSIPAMLSNGEYVITAKATSAYGADFMNALNQQRVTFAQPQSMSQNSNNGPTMVYLSPEDRALLRAAVERPVELYTENTKIAQSANAGNVILAQRGSR